MFAVTHARCIDGLMEFLIVVIIGIAVTEPCSARMRTVLGGMQRLECIRKGQIKVRLAVP